MQIKEIELPAGQTEVTLDCSPFSPGIYLVCMENASDSFTKRFVKR